MQQVLATHHKAMAVKDQFVLAASLVDVNHGDIGIVTLGNHPYPLPAFVHYKG